MKKKYLPLIALLATSAPAMAQGWPAAYEGVMLQGFYWNSYDATNWKNLESQADELSKYFKLIWIPQSGNCGAESMGYDPVYWFDNYKSAFGSEQELRSMIQTFKQKGLATIADVVINHRKSITGWLDFPKETYKGNTYQLFSTDICKDDCSGQTAQWAKDNGYELSPNNDTGENATFARDLDHNSQNVQTCVKAYLDFLLNDLGYAGVRYDMVKGYSASFTALYNQAAKPEFSVGEYFDDNKQLVTNWINATKAEGEIQSAAFDFPMRYAIRDAANNGKWSNLSRGGLATDQAYSRYAVTFIENHDTQTRDNDPQDPIRKDTLAANAYLLAMPGTPCVFLQHWLAYKPEIKNMILLRNIAGINNQSLWTENESYASRYVLTSTGSHGKLLAAVGASAADYNPASAEWALAAEGKNYRYFIEKSNETAWPSLPSGTYFGTTRLTLRAITNTNGAKIVYTIDGSTPSASSMTVDNATTITLPEGAYTLKVALLSGGRVWGMTEREYDVKSFQPYNISVNINADQVGWQSMNVWSWGGDGTHNTTATKWPGDPITTTASVGDKQWYALNYTMNSENDYVNFVFNTNNGSLQTENVQNIKKTSYLLIINEKDNSGHYKVKDVTADYTAGISHTQYDKPAKGGYASNVTTIDGRVLRTFNTQVSLTQATDGLPHGIYIVDGKKVVR